MSQGVAVGFSPAVTSVVTGGTAAVAPANGEAAGGGLFAALLALLGGAQTTAAAEAVIPAPEGAPAGAPAFTPAEPAVTTPALIFDMAKAVPAVDASAAPVLEQMATTEQGKALLKTLGDALIALNDAADAGEPPDPALEKKLDDALDEMAAYLGVALTAPAPVAPTISAEASGGGALPEIAPLAAAAVAPAIPVGPTPADPADAAAPSDAGGKAGAAEPASKSTILPLSATDAPLVASEPTTVIQPVAADDEIPATEVADAAPATEVANAAPTTEVVSPTSATAKPVAEGVPAPIVRLARLLDGLAEKVEPQSPELARKLEALADQLRAGKLPDAVVAALASDDGTVAEPQLARIIEALSAPKPTTATQPAVATSPFVAPSLQLPETLAPAEPEQRAAAAEESDAAPEADDTDRPAPRIKLASEPEPKAQATEHKPTAAAAHVARQDPAPGQPADQSTAPQQAGAVPATAAPARAVHAAYQAPVQQLNLPQVAFEVARQFQAGNTRFQIRLDPPELGRIDVKLDVDKSGAVNARMTVERPETLDLMQRDQRALQQALQQAGLDSSKTNLEFSLRQNPFAQQQGMGDGRGQQPSFLSPTGGSGGGDDIADVQSTTNLYRGTASAGGVNLFV